MNIYDKILSILKLPLRIIVLLAIILGLLLFLPNNLIKTLKLEQFIEEYGKYIGITFLFSIGYIVVIFFPWIYKVIKFKGNSKKYIENLKNELNNISFPSIYFL